MGFTISLHIYKRTTRKLKTKQDEKINRESENRSSKTSKRKQ